MRKDVIDQVLAIAMHPSYDCETAMESMSIILNLTQSPESHTYIIRREVVESMLKVCEQRYKMINQQSIRIQQRKKEDPMVINLLKYVNPG